MGKRRNARPSERDERVTVWPLPPAEAFRALLGGPVEQDGVEPADDACSPDDNQAPAPGQ